MRLWRRAVTNHGSLQYLEGRLCLADNDARGVLTYFEPVGKVQIHHQPSLLYTKADALLRLARWGEAATAFRQMLDITPVNANVRLGLCRVWLERRRPRRTLDEALAAIGLVYHNPQARGVACQWLGRVDDAVRAFEVAVSQNMFLVDTHWRLAKLYGAKLGNIERAAKHRALDWTACRQQRVFRERGALDADRFGIKPDVPEVRLDAVGTPKSLPPIHDEVIVVSGFP